MKIFIIILFLFSNQLAFCQNKDEVNLLIKNQPHSHKTHWEIAKNNNSTMEIVLSQFFLFYKNFISSQDSQSCGFTPSCSVYAVESIKKQGLIIGLLDAFDRLMRCNGFSPENYNIDYSKKLLFDPVKNIHNHEL